MPYTLPTVDQFTTRFPIFADSDPDLIGVLLTEASGSVDNSWVEADYQPAIMYLAAHLLATDNSAEGEDVEVGGQTGAIASESFGGLSTSYANASAGSLSSSERFGSTEYGRRFLVLLRANRGGPVVV